VDKILAGKIRMRGHRYIDDYELAFTTRSEAEEAQAVFEEVLAEFELAINRTKTEVLELPQPFHEGWAHELLTFPIRDGRASQTITDLIALFSRAADMAAGTRSGPLKYAVLCCRDIDISRRNVWKALQDLVWTAVSAEPTTMAAAIDLLAEKAKTSGFDVDKHAAGEVVEALIHAHSPRQNSSEVAWGVWAAIALEIEMSPKAAEAAARMEDDFVALLALDAHARGLYGKHALDLSRWEALTDYDEVLAGPHWLLAYEGAVRGWLQAPSKRVEADSFFKVLKAHDVRFYDGDQSRNPFTGPAGPLPGGLVPDDYV
jgi:hypothetical protein